MTTQTINAQSVTATARWTAAVRAQESSREDALFVDPWAAALAGAAGMDWLAQRPQGSGLPMALRTRYFDDFLLRVCGAGGIRQVVLLAAGLDTRAYRLPWLAGTQLYELDKAEVLDCKAAVLAQAGAQPTCVRTAITADLTAPWAGALIAAGFDAREPTVWLLEGLLFYLPAPQIIQLLDALTPLSAPGSWLGFDIINAAVFTSPWTRPWVEMQAEQGAPWIGSMDDPVGLLAERGWRATLTQAGAPDAHYGRWTLPVIPVAAPAMPHNWYVTAQR
jgi:methyltransferase (TIGR00027 family)